MQKSELEGVLNNSRGMPDCWHIDASGKSSPEVFQKHFGLPRRFRNDRKLVERNMSRQGRLKGFLWALLHYRNLGQPIFLDGDEYTSPEAQTLARFDEGWPLRSEEDLVEFAKLNDEDRKVMLGDLHAVRHGKESGFNQIKMQALANRANITTDKAFAVMISCAVESWLRARNELANWLRLGDEERARLAEAIFCGFTFFGRRALEEACAIEPQVLAYYCAFRGFQPASTPALAPITALAVSTPADPDAKGQEAPSPPDGATNAHSRIVGISSDNNAWEESPEGQGTLAVSTIAAEAPQSFQQLYALIASISQTAQADHHAGAEPAFRIRDLIYRHIQRLIELNHTLSADEISQLIDRYCSAVLHMTDVLDFAGSEQRDMVPVLRAAWNGAVVTALEDGRSHTWFEMNLREREHLPSFVERFKGQKSKIAQASGEIAAIRAQWDEAKYTARTTLKASETRKQTEISVAHGELETIRVEAAHLLVPEGRTLDDLMEDESLLQTAQFEVDELDTAAVRALQSVVKALADYRLDNQGQEVHHEQDGPSPGLASDNMHERPLAHAETASARERVAHASDEPLNKLSTNETGVPAQQAAPPVETVTKDISTIALSVQAPEIHPLASEEEAGIQQAASQGVDTALRHLQYTESREDAHQAFRIAFDQFSQVPASLIEAIVMHWLEAGHINVAYQILHDARDTRLVISRVLDASLFRSAFYGMNLWPKDRDALSNTQRDLNLLNHKDLEEQLDRRPSGKLVPYLLVCATLQPALFAGSETQAPTLLKLAVNYFDGPLKQLISNVADFAMRGGRVDLDALRNEESLELDLAAAKLRDQVNAWVDVNAQRTTRWHALRVALKILRDQPVFAPAITAICQGEKGDSASVRLFVNTYSSHVESRRLLDELVQKIRADYSAPTDHIDSQAYLSFCQQVDSLVAIAQAWLLEVMPADVRPKETREFLERFHTQLERSIATLMTNPRHADLEHRAGASLELRLPELDELLGAERVVHIDALPLHKQFPKVFLMDEVPEADAELPAPVQEKPKPVPRASAVARLEPAPVEEPVKREIKQLVMAGDPFVVRDAKTSEDLTRSILLQIILEEETGGVPIFSTQMLSQIIRFYGHAMQGMMGAVLEKNLQAFTDMQSRFAEQARGLYDPAKLTPDASDCQASRNGKPCR